MESPKEMLPASSSPSAALSLPASESQISALLYDVSQKLQMGMQNMLQSISEIEQSSAVIVEGLDKCKESASETSKMLDEERERVQKVAISVLEMLTGNGII